jgi:predicted phage terminase large subunit-like protein
MLRYYFAVEQRSTDRIVLSWDIALSEKEAADYSACVVLLNRGDLYYVLDVIRGKFPFNKLIDKIIEVKERYGKAASLVIEDGGISYGLIQALREKHVNVVDYKPKGDKAERLISQIDLFEGGSVLLPKDAPWLEAFVAELMRGTINLFKHCVSQRTAHNFVALTLHVSALPSTLVFIFRRFEQYFDAVRRYRSAEMITLHFIAIVVA